MNLSYPVKKILLIIFSFSFFTAHTQQPLNIMVSSTNGDDDPTSGKPAKTLAGAYLRIPPLNQRTGPVNIIFQNDGDIYLGPNTNTFVWETTGTILSPINIYSANSCFVKLTRVVEDQALPMIKFKNVSRINIRNVHFYRCVTGALELDNADYCSIQYCKFSGENFVTSKSTGIITIMKNDGNGPSEYNVVANNKFFNMFVSGTEEDRNLHHGVYPGNGANYNEIYNNTFIGPPGQGVAMWHGNYQYNKVMYNVSIQSTDDVTIGSSNGAHPFSTGNSEGECSTIIGNDITENFTHNQQQDPVWIPDYPCNDASNTLSPNNVYMGDLYPNDPVWIGFDPSKITGRVVSGDFNNDGEVDEIAAIYDNGDNTADIFVWSSDDQRGVNNKTNAFILGTTSAGYWWHGTYDASKITDRVVVGDFDNDGYFDDIAAIYEAGPGSTRIDVFKKTGAESFQLVTFFPTANNYTATNVTARVVSGSFDTADTLHDDIAVFYDYGGGQTKIHVFASNASQFSYSTYWDTQTTNPPSTYPVANFTGRIVSGNFDNSGRNDIAVFYDIGGGNTRVDVFAANANKFTETTANASLPFPAAQFTKRVVSGSFYGTGVNDDVAFFQDNGNGNATLWVLPSGSGFSSIQKWTADGFDANKITGRIVAGQFEKNSTTKNGIAAFYDYSQVCGSLRTNVWSPQSNQFVAINGELGFPWITKYWFGQGGGAPVVEAIETKKAARKNIFPNPTNTVITVDNTTEPKIRSVNIYNTLGKRVTPEVISPQGAEIIIDVRNLSQGVYVLTTIDEKGKKESHKVLVK